MRSHSHLHVKSIELTLELCALIKNIPITYILSYTVLVGKHRVLEEDRRNCISYTHTRDEHCGVA